jgi:hypothetical protein
VNANIGRQLGQSLCSHNVEVTGIALASENTRDVVFTETTTYDQVKLHAISDYVQALFARLSILPIQPVAVKPASREFRYESAVVDPSDGRRYLVGLTLLPKREAEERARTTKDRRIIN